MTQKFMGTMGVQYRHEAHPSGLPADPDGYVLVWAEDEAHARRLMHEAYGDGWAFLYGEADFKESYHPKGVIHVLGDPPQTEQKYETASWAYRAGLAAGTLYRLREILNRQVPDSVKNSDDEHTWLRRLFTEASTVVSEAIETVDSAEPYEFYTLADLDGTDDEADWVTEGHVLDAHEVEWLRSRVMKK